MVKTYSSTLTALTGLVFLGCGVESTTESTGGVEDRAASEGCPAGVAVVLSDYVSTQVALSSLKGKTESASLISTASSETDGLAFALSGDVGLPSAPTESGELVLLDRFGTNVVTWVDPQTAEVIDQLPVGGGFESNPQDYVEVGDRAFISRWGQNLDPGQEDFDDGGDVLIVDLEEREIIDSIVMPTADDLPARPGSMLRVGEEIIVTLDRTALDFSETGETMLVGISVEDETISFEQTLDGFIACGRLAQSPDGERLAVACTGPIDQDGMPDVDESALILFDANETPLEEIERFSAEAIAGHALQNDVVFADDQTVLLKTQDAWGGDTNNRWLAFDLESEETTEFVEASPAGDGMGQGLVYGRMLCAPGCSELCLMPDADAGVLQRVRLSEDGELELLSPVTVEDDIGLPPVGLAYR